MYVTDDPAVRSLSADECWAVLDRAEVLGLLLQLAHRFADLAQGVHCFLGGRAGRASMTRF